MRKLFAVLCAVALLAALAVPAIAEDIDLSALSWSERLALREQLSDRNEWQPVEVPEGVWVVGKEIPRRAVDSDLRDRRLRTHCLGRESG